MIFKAPRRLTVVRNIVLAINITANNTLHLHEHIVDSSRDGSRARAIANAAAPAYLDRVGRWVGQQCGQNGVGRPGV